MSQHHDHGRLGDHSHAAGTRTGRSHALAADAGLSMLRLSAGHRLLIAASVLAVMWLMIWQVLA
jgi:hypothetical protein